MFVLRLVGTLLLRPSRSTQTSFGANPGSMKEPNGPKTKKIKTQDSAAAALPTFPMSTHSSSSSPSRRSERPDWSKVLYVVHMYL